MRPVLILLAVIAVGYFAFPHLEKLLPRSRPAAASASARPPSLVSRPEMLPASDLTEADYLAWGMPSLNDFWDSRALSRVHEALDKIRAQNIRHLPGANSAYGKAFFGKLRSSVTGFFRLSTTNKVSTYNAFGTLIPVYGAALNAGLQCDMEIALLIGLQFELMTAFMEDQHFISERSRISIRVSRDLEGNIWHHSGKAIFPLESPYSMQQGIEILLDALANQTALRPEARVLGLSYVSRHLPAIVRRMHFSTLDRRLLKNRAVETNEQARAYYDSMLDRWP